MACVSAKVLTVAHIIPSMHLGRNNELTHDDSLVPNVHYRGMKPRSQMLKIRKCRKLVTGNITEIIIRIPKCGKVENTREIT